MSRFLLVLCALAGCKKLEGTQTSTDHYVEHIEYAGQRIGDVSVTSKGDGDTFTVSFAAPDPSWKDPREPRIREGAPTSLLAVGGCTLTAKREDGKSAAIQPTTCTVGGKSLSIELGQVWVKDDILYVGAQGKYGDASYMLTYPLIVVDEPLKLKR